MSKVATALRPAAVLAEVTRQPEAEVGRRTVRAKMKPAGGFDGLMVVSFSVQSKGPDDKLYAADPWLRQHIPRGFSVVVERKEAGTCTVVTVMQGPSKFEGVSRVDDDDVSEADPEARIFDSARVEAWQRAGTLSITRETKENGKFAIVKMFEWRGQQLAVGGSKGQHVVVSLATVDSVIEAVADAPLLAQIFRVVKADWERLARVCASFPGHSVVGELCDGMHFVPLEEGREEQPYVKWFGLFGSSGASMDPRVALAELAGAGLPVVSHQPVDPHTALDAIIREARCGAGEGSVLYFRNTESGEVVLAKNKTAEYIIKRMTREVLKSPAGYNVYDRLERRVVDAADYHGLNTVAAARLCRQMFGLAEWMMAERLPATAVYFDAGAHSPPRSAALSGFANVWRQYVRSGGGEDVRVSPEDFVGGFDAAAFAALVHKPIRGELAREAERNIMPGEGTGATQREEQKAEGAEGLGVGGRNGMDSGAVPPAHVVFLQGVQGSGKSALGAALAARLAGKGLQAAVVEQDQFAGHSPSCRSYLRHLLQYTDTDVVLVTRCNANWGHYAAYLAIAHELGALVSFLCPSDLSEEATCGPSVVMAVNLASIAERSAAVAASELSCPNKRGLYLSQHSAQTAGEDSEMASPAGDLEVPVIVARTLAEFEPHPQATLYRALRDPSPEACLSQALRGSCLTHARPEEALAFATAHSAELLSLRRSMQELCEELMPAVLHPPAKALVCPSLSDCSLVAFYPSLEDSRGPGARRLRQAMDNVLQQEGCHAAARLPPGCNQDLHLTQAFLPSAGSSSKRRQAMASLPPGALSGPGSQVVVAVSHLVVRRSDGHTAFRSSVPAGLWVQSGRPHITAYVPPGARPAESASYVYANDDSVLVWPLCPLLELRMTCRWS